MKIKTIEAPRVIIESDNDLYNYFAWPTVERTKNNRIAVACSGYRVEHICPFGKAIICFSDDEGESFSEPKAVIDTVLDDRDAGLCAFGESGLVLTSFNNTVDFQRNNCRSDLKICYDYLDTVSPDDEKRDLGSEFRISNDNGESWSAIYHSPITSPHGPIETSDGRILWVGAVFNLIFDYDDKCRNDNIIQVWEIHTNGKMTLVGKIPDVYIDRKRLSSCEPYMFETESGKLICHIRMEGGGRFTTYQTESADYGKTWSDPYPLLPVKGGAPAHIIKHSSGVLISAIGYREKPYGIHVMLSDDNGRTWQTGNAIYEQDIDDDIGYPATVELSDGKLLTVFYAHDEETQPAKIMMQKWEITE